jgi:glycosyltransferase involved in cell wall biosynthesis
MIENPYVSIVSGTYNRFESLKRMIYSVRSSVGIGIPYEIVMVDGGSNDGSLEWMREQDDIVLIEQGALLGLIQAYNVGFNRSRGKYVIMPNDDVEFRFEGIRLAIAYMDDHLDVGIGCFYQNRHSAEYTLDSMPAIRNGKKVSTVYGQVCIIPRWLLTKCGGWNDYVSYGGDSDLSCQVLEMGFKVEGIPCACINDFQIDDDLRKLNNPVDHLTGGHPDSAKWRNKWTRNGVLGPVIKFSPTVTNPCKRIPRITYAPLYEDKVFPHQLKTKIGLRKALSEKYLVSEINYQGHLDLLEYDIDNFNPDICLVQFQHPKIFTYDFMMRMKDEYKNTIFMSWSGDYHENVHGSKEYKEICKMFDLASFAIGDIAKDYVDYGINYKYWQIGYEDYNRVPDSEINKNRYDIVFLGNCYDPRRQKMAELLRRQKDLKVGLFGQWPSHIGSDGNTIYDFSAGDVLYRSSKIAIGDNLFPKSIGYVSNRLFQMLHAGAFVFQQKIEGMEYFMGFEDGVHLVVWEDFDDLGEKIREWLPKEREREIIARQGKRFTDDNHSFKRRVEELQIMIDEYKKEKS